MVKTNYAQIKEAIRQQTITPYVEGVYGQFESYIQVIIQEIDLSLVPEAIFYMNIPGIKTKLRLGPTGSRMSSGIKRVPERRYFLLETGEIYTHMPDYSNQDLDPEAEEFTSFEKAKENAPWAFSEKPSSPKEANIIIEAVEKTVKESNSKVLERLDVKKARSEFDQTLLSFLQSTP